MSAIYGILGDADLSELSAMGKWSVAPGVLFA
jgi:hypothetical protein